MPESKLKIKVCIARIAYCCISSTSSRVFLLSKVEVCTSCGAGCPTKCDRLGGSCVCLRNDGSRDERGLLLLSWTFRVNINRLSILLLLFLILLDGFPLLQV